jgi:hypothetical protein
MSYMSLFEKKGQATANKVIDYYEGDSKSHLMKFLQDYRKNALKKGLQPRTRNIVKMVIDKSGMLFNGKAPVLEVYADANSVTPDIVASAKTQVIFESANWVEFFNNFDAMVRMLKTCYVLVQYSVEKKRWLFQALSQKNCGVSLDIFGDLETLIYETGVVKDQGTTYRVWTALEVIDLIVDENGNEVITERLPNIYGIIPASVFHDTNIPFSDDDWNTIPQDLVEVNDIYNLHLCDSEFASMWNKNPTLFTNARIQGGVSGTMVEQQNFGELLPRWVPSNDPGFVGGPGTVVAVETDGEAVYLDYKKPDVALMPMDDMVSKWVADFAGDWSVNIKLDGNGSAAESGFKLVVEELPNLELRKERSRMFETGFKKLYEVLKVLANIHGYGLPEDSVLFITFAQPDLPVDEKASEEVWSIRINERRATRVDYFMSMHGLSKEEATLKVAEIDASLTPISSNL